MPIKGTLSGTSRVIPANSYIGPIQYNGRLYTIGFDSSSGTNIFTHVSGDWGATWYSKSGWNIGGAPRSIWVTAGNGVPMVIVVCTPSGQIMCFSIATNAAFDADITQAMTVHANVEVSPATATTGGSASVTKVADGSIVAVFNGTTAKIMGTEYAQIYYSRSTNDGQTWSAPTMLSGGSSINYEGPIVIPGSAGQQAHFFYKETTATSAFLRRSLSSTGALSVQASTTATSYPGATIPIFSNPVRVTSGIRAYYQTASSTVSSMRAVDGNTITPTFAATTGLTGAPVSGTASHTDSYASLDGTVYRVMTNSGNIVTNFASDANNLTFSSFKSDVTGSWVRPSASIVTKDTGEVVLGYMVQASNDTTTYGEEVITPAPIPDPVTATPTVTATPAITSVDLSWGAVANATSYDIERGGVVIQAAHANTSYTDSTVAPSTSYTYRVRGVNSLGAGPWSTPVNTTTNAIPPVVLRNNFESGQADGTAITAANSTGYGNTAFNSITATPLYETTNARDNTAMVVSTSTPTYVIWNELSQTSVFARMYLYATGYPAMVTALFDIKTSNGTSIGPLMATHQWSLYSNVNGSMTAGNNTTTDIIGINQWNRIEFKYDITNGQQEIRVFKGANVEGTIPDVVYTGTGSGLGSLATTLEIGGRFPGTIDDVAISNTDWLGSSNIVLKNDLESGEANGTVVTTTNADGTGNDLFNFVSGSPTYDTIIKRGASSVKFASSATNYLGWSEVSYYTHTEMYARIYLYVSDFGAGNTRLFNIMNASNTLVAGLVLGASGLLQTLDANSSGTGTILSPNNTIPINTWCRIEFGLEIKTGTHILRVYSGSNADGDTPDWSATVTARPAGTVVEKIRIGNVLGQSSVIYMDDISVGDTTAAFGATLSPPTNLVAVHNSGDVDLDWTAPSGGLTPTSYVYRYRDISTLQPELVISSTSSGTRMGTYIQQSFVATHDIIESIFFKSLTASNVAIQDVRSGTTLIEKTLTPAVSSAADITVTFDSPLNVIPGTTYWIHIYYVQSNAVVAIQTGDVYFQGTLWAKPLGDEIEYTDEDMAVTINPGGVVESWSAWLMHPDLDYPATSFTATSTQSLPDGEYEFQIASVYNGSRSAPSNTSNAVTVTTGTNYSEIELPVDIISSATQTEQINHDELARFFSVISSTTGTDQHTFTETMRSFTIVSSPTVTDDHLPGPTTATYRVAFAAIATPETRTDHHVRYRHSKSEAGGRQVDVVVSLWSANIQIASWAHTDVNELIAGFDRTLTDPQAEAITDYSSLELQFDVTFSGPLPEREYRIYWTEFAAPPGEAAVDRRPWLGAIEGRPWVGVGAQPRLTGRQYVGR